MVVEEILALSEPEYKRLLLNEVDSTLISRIEKPEIFAVLRISDA